MPTASELRDAFAKFDANGDGYLSVDELVGVFTRPVDDGEPMTEEQARAYVAKHDKNGDGRLDLDEFAASLVAEQVEQPLRASHFREQGRLTLLVLGTAGGDSTASGAPTAGADIRLLSARKLVAHIDGGGKMAIRQALEAAGVDVFLDAATVRGLLPELETKDGVRCTFSGVVALSYAWVTPADPDPQRAQLLALRPVLVWWMCERARAKLGQWEGGGDATIQTADFGVFIDFMSMFQPDDTTGAKPAYTKPAEQASFGRALRNIGLLYGHAGSVVYKMTETPLPADGDPDRVYHRRGWCHTGPFPRARDHGLGRKSPEPNSKKHLKIDDFFEENTANSVICSRKTTHHRRLFRAKHLNIADFFEGNVDSI